MSNVTYHLKQSEIAVDHMIEIHSRVLPGEILVQTIEFVRHIFRDIHPIVRIDVDTFVESTAEQLDAHDGEDQPKHQTDQQNVENGRNGSDQGIDDHLRISVIQPSFESIEQESYSNAFESGECFQRSQCPESSHRFESGNIGYTESI